MQRGELTQEQAKNHPERTSSPEPWAPSHRSRAIFISRSCTRRLPALCSDGLSNVMADQEMSLRLRMACARAIAARDFCASQKTARTGQCDGRDGALFGKEQSYGSIHRTLLDNRYEILEVIGTGGMAVVYKARCNRLNRLVAIKVLKQELSQDEEFRRRFHAESQAVAMLAPEYRECLRRVALRITSIISSWSSSRHYAQAVPRAERPAQLERSPAFFHADRQGA